MTVVAEEGGTGHYMPGSMASFIDGVPGNETLAQLAPDHKRQLLEHNVRAVYQFDPGWYNANPANLDPLPRIEEVTGAYATIKKSLAVIAGCVVAPSTANCTAALPPWPSVS